MTLGKGLMIVAMVIFAPPLVLVLSGGFTMKGLGLAMVTFFLCLIWAFIAFMKGAHRSKG